MRGFHCGQKLTLHKQAGYICADRLFQSQRICLQTGGGPTAPTITVEVGKKKSKAAHAASTQAPKRTDRVLMKADILTN